MNEYFEQALSALFPLRCPVCDDAVKPYGAMICQTCEEKLVRVESPFCMQCGMEIQKETESFCNRCRRKKSELIRGMALFNYNETARQSVSRIKYNGRKEVLRYYAIKMQERFQKDLLNLKIQAFIPVPISNKRRKQRGFNQAEVLADYLGKACNIPILNVLSRKETEALKDLSPSERRINLSKALQCTTLPEGIIRVCIIDDIYTTGATVEACARQLKLAGAKEVYSIVLYISMLESWRKN